MFFVSDKKCSYLAVLYSYLTSVYYLITLINYTSNMENLSTTAVGLRVISPFNIYTNKAYITIRSLHHYKPKLQTSWRLTQTM